MDPFRIRLEIFDIIHKVKNVAKSHFFKPLNTSDSLRSDPENIAKISTSSFI